MWVLTISRTFMAFQNNLRIVAIALFSCTTGMGEQALVVKEEQPEDLSLRTREVMMMMVIMVMVLVMMVKKVMMVMVMVTGVVMKHGMGERGPQRCVRTCVS